MQATVPFNLGEIISKLEKFNSSGCLKIDEGLVSWKIYLDRGQLKYVYCSAQLIDQLRYYLHYLELKQTAAALKKLPAPYLKIQSSIQEKSPTNDIYCKIIGWLLAGQYLTAPQGLKLIELITKDAFQSCLWLKIGTHYWKDKEPIPYWITEQLGDCFSLDISEYINLSNIRLQQWQKCSERLLSYHQRPYLSSGWETKSLPAGGTLSKENLKELANIIRGRTSIRQLSILLKKDELQVAQILSPYIDKKIICLRDSPAPLDRLPNIPRPQKNVRQTSSISPLETDKQTQTAAEKQLKTWKIVCIDDSPTILNEMQRFLDRDKYEVTAIDDPVEAVPTIFRLKPDLILLDITMPKINGYKLCGLLRGSKNCDNTPIVMVTGNTGFIDKARAKIAGATDYFTKPFSKESLIQVVDKYLD